MTRTIAVTAMFCLTTLPMAQTVQAASPWSIWDRIEDRIDRRESILDERVDNGRRDVVEDRIDRVESRRDRADKSGSRLVNAHERRSWRRYWGW